MPDPDQPQPADRVLAWATSWRATLALVGAVLTARVALLLVSGFELSADEAHYWEWSERLDLSYYSKGPGVAWTIAAATRLLGDAEWAVRLPAAVSAAVSSLAVAWLAWRAAGRDPRAAFLGALAFTLLPAFQVTALFMTIDAPYVTAWALACVGVVLWHERVDAGRPAWALAALTGALVGVGFLYKYTALLILPGIALDALLRRGALAGPRTPVAARGLAFTLALGAVATPVALWNHDQGWPTVAHLLGHLGAPGGDIPDSNPGEPWTILWVAEYLVGQVGVAGPLLFLCALALIARLPSDAPERAVRRTLALVSLPMFAVYLGVSFVTDVEANWPIAGYVGLLGLVGAVGVRELGRYRGLVRAWEADPERPKRGLLRRKPETPFQVAWHWSVGVGVACAAGVAVGALALPLVERTPLLGDIVPSHRLQGGRDLAASIEAALPEGGAAFVMADRYTTASLASYYLARSMGAGAPLVTSGSAHLGDRRSSFDVWPDTDPRAASLLGRDAVLVGGGPARWGRAFRWAGGVRAVEGPGRLSVGRGFGGPIPYHQRDP